MADKVLMKGNEAIGEAAIKAGCRHFFGYPITPQTEISAYLAKKMPKVGGLFMQAESEVAAINMVYGAAGAGVRAMTSSSSPGISLKSEGISYIAGADLPCVIVNIMRAGPGLGGILPAQGDYFQATKGGGHGDYKMIVLAPASVQEAVDLTIKAFDMADQYRMPVMLLGDGMLGQMMEPVEFPETAEIQVKTDKEEWATTGTKGKRKKNIINSLDTNPDTLEQKINQRAKKYELIAKTEQKAETENIQDANLVLVSYGSCARIAKAVMESAREEGLKVGLVRPITLWPFASEAVSKASKNAKAMLCVEMSQGQMVEDVKLHSGATPTYFYGRSGGMIPQPDDILEEVKKILKAVK